jgi:hypothetical protein
MKGKIYCISNDINDKLYIGKTTLLTIEERFQEHCRDSRKTSRENRPLYRAIKLYGEEHFTIRLIEECDLSLLEEREQYWISYYNTYHNGYNATLGGDGKMLYDYNIFVKDYQNGSLIQEIAEKYNCSTDTVTKAIRLANLDGEVNSRNRQKNAVAQYSKTGVYIQSFASHREAARWLIEQGSKSNLTSLATNIGRVVKGNRKTAEGYIWKAE